MRKGAIAIAALALGGCSGTWFDAPVQRAEAQGSPEAYYRFLVSDSRAVSMFRRKPGVTLQISPLRMSVAPQPGDWMTCMRVLEPGKPDQLIAFFIRDRAVIDYRVSVVIDRCEAEPYAPLVETVN
jgi:hypothetical protein